MRTAQQRPPFAVLLGSRIYAPPLSQPLFPPALSSDATSRRVGGGAHARLSPPLCAHFALPAHRPRPVFKRERERLGDPFPGGSCECRSRRTRLRHPVRQRHVGPLELPRRRETRRERELCSWKRACHHAVCFRERPVPGREVHGLALPGLQSLRGASARLRRRSSPFDPGSAGGAAGRREWHCLGRTRRGDCHELPRHSRRGQGSGDALGCEYVGGPAGGRGPRQGHRGASPQRTRCRSGPAQPAAAAAAAQARLVPEAAAAEARHCGLQPRAPGGAAGLRHRQPIRPGLHADVRHHFGCGPRHKVSDWAHHSGRHPDRCSVEPGQQRRAAAGLARPPGRPQHGCVATCVRLSHRLP